MTRRLTIAMDGPAGAGKSTYGKIVANELGYLYIDTGAMYRALALKALRTGIAIDDDEALGRMAGQSDVRLERTESGGCRVFLDGEDVSAHIRTPDVTRVVSRVSASMALREHTVEAQRQMAQAGGVVVDGRDIGSYVLPRADVKLFITASLAERAERRLRQLAQSGHTVDRAQLEQEIAARDAQDENKGVGSLVRTADAILIDTTGHTVEQVVEEILTHCRRAAG